jgi:ATP-dependent DNA ligase
MEQLRPRLGGHAGAVLHSSKHNEEVQLCAFDVLAMDGDDLRHLPLSMRKANLARLLARRPDGIFISDFEQGEIGPELFREACEFGLEGLVSKHSDRPYRGGRQARGTDLSRSRNNLQDCDFVHKPGWCSPS